MYLIILFIELKDYITENVNLKYWHIYALFDSMAIAAPHTEPQYYDLY